MAIKWETVITKTYKSLSMHIKTQSLHEKREKIIHASMTLPALIPLMNRPTINISYDLDIFAKPSNAAATTAVLLFLNRAPRLNKMRRNQESLFPNMIRHGLQCYTC